MSLIKCPECSKEISDQTDQCPHCGYPIVRKSGEQNNTIKNKPTTALKLLAVICGIIAILVLLSAFGDLSKIF